MRNYRITHKKLIENSISLIAHYGYTNTSIRDIAYKTGIKESTFYHYFINKKNLLIKLINIFETEVRKLKADKNDTYKGQIYLQNKIIELFKIINDDSLCKIWRVINMEYYSEDFDVIIKINNIKRTIKNYIKNILNNLIENNLIINDNFDLTVNDLFNNILCYFIEYSENKIKRNKTSDIEDNLYKYLKYFWEKIKI